MNILSIGNSFSQDAQRYLHQIAKAAGTDLETFNLYIGSCPLTSHHGLMRSQERAYTLEMNGVSTGFFVSLQETLTNRDWDVVTIQQVSSQSPYYETYQPYLAELAEYIRQTAPKAKLIIHQTWAYEQGSQRLTEELGYTHYKQMLAGIIDAYRQAALDIRADGILPAGELFDALLDSGIPQVHRDTFHAGLGLGRYALGLLWYRFLTGKAVENNTFNDFDEDISAQQIAIAKNCVAALVEKYGI